MTGELDRGAGPQSLTNIANGTEAAGGFSFDEGTMRSLVGRWLDLADSYEASRRLAQDMIEVKGPGLDFASASYAKAASQSGTAYQNYLVHNIDYCLHQAQLFQNALDDYLGVEHTNVADMHKSDPQGPQPGI